VYGVNVEGFEGVETWSNIFTEEEAAEAAASYMQVLKPFTQKEEEEAVPLGADLDFDPDWDRG
jgi:hypothetical protein